MLNCAATLRPEHMAAMIIKRGVDINLDFRANELLRHDYTLYMDIIYRLGFQISW